MMTTMAGMLMELRFTERRTRYVENYDGHNSPPMRAPKRRNRCCGADVRRDKRFG